MSSKLKFKARFFQYKLHGDVISVKCLRKCVLVGGRARTKPCLHVGQTIYDSSWVSIQQKNCKY